MSSWHNGEGREGRRSFKIFAKTFQNRSEILPLWLCVVRLYWMHGLQASGEYNHLSPWSRHSHLQKWPCILYLCWLATRFQDRVRSFPQILLLCCSGHMLESLLFLIWFAIQPIYRKLLYLCVPITQMFASREQALSQCVQLRSVSRHKSSISWQPEDASCLCGVFQIVTAVWKLTS